ncbi:helix-turn-helix domain-containing protein [Eubacterium aggregans]
MARHLGTAREVVTRMLKNFQQEGWVKLSRGSVYIIDGQGLRSLCATP